MVRVIWHGHACFELQGKNVTIVIDPFGGIGILEPKAEADVVLCSHSHLDHSNVGPVLGKDGEVLKGFVGLRKVKGVPVKGVATFHDDVLGSKRGKNSVYTFSLDGVQFCHLGDLGHDLSSAVVEKIGRVDVVFVPVGGYYTIGPETATEVCEKLKPKIIIPMHYRMPEFPSSLEVLKTVDAFLEGKGNVERVKGPIVNIKEDKLPRERKIIVLSLE